MICVIAVLYGFAIAFFVHSLSTQAVPKVVLGPMPRPSRKMVPPPPPPKHILEDAYRAAEKEARRAAMEEAPKLKEMEALRQTREANKERRLLERWQNATRNVERKEKKMAERKRIADAKRAAELHMTLDELHAHDEQMLLRAKARADLADWLERFNSTGNASSAAATSTVSTSGGGHSSSSSDGGSSSNTALLASAAQCLDGTTAAFVFADRSIRRELVRQLAEEAVRGSRPFSTYKFLLAGVLDQARVLWHAILDAEIKGVTAVLPEPVLTTSLISLIASLIRCDSGLAGAGADCTWNGRRGERRSERRLARHGLGPRSVCTADAVLCWDRRRASWRRRHRR
jgi:hypothetical protein